MESNSPRSGPAPLIHTQHERDAAIAVFIALGWAALLGAWLVHAVLA